MNADPVPEGPMNADPDPERPMNADPDPQPCFVHDLIVIFISATDPLGSFVGSKSSQNVWFGTETDSTDIYN